MSTQTHLRKRPKKNGAKKRRRKAVYPAKPSHRDTVKPRLTGFPSGGGSGPPVRNSPEPEAKQTTYFRLPKLPDRNAVKKHLPKLPDWNAVKDRLPKLPDWNAVKDRLPKLPDWNAVKDRLPKLPDWNAVKDRLPKLPGLDALKKLRDPLPGAVHILFPGQGIRNQIAAGKARLHQWKTLSGQRRAAKREAREERRTARENALAERRTARENARKERRAARENAREERRAARENAREERRAARENAREERRAARENALTERRNARENALAMRRTLRQNALEARRAQRRERAAQIQKKALEKRRYLTARLRPPRTRRAGWLHGSGIRLLLSACTAAALSMTMGSPPYESIPEAVWNPLYSLSEKSVLPLLIAICLLSRFADDNRSWEKRPLLLFPLNAFLSLVWLMAEGFRSGGDVSVLFATPGQWVKSTLYFIGIFAGLNTLSGLLAWFLSTGGDPRKRSRACGSALARCAQAHPFPVTFFPLLLLWIPHLIAAYPGNPTPSAYNQIAQYFGVMPWTNFHPPFSTLLIGFIVKLGSHVSGNFGLFLYTVVQALILAAVIGWQFCLLRDLDAPAPFQSLLFAACALCPYYTSYITVLLKDNFYSCCFLLLIIELIYAGFLQERFFKSLRHLFLFGLAEAGVILLRHNGKYVVYPIVIALAASALASCLRRRRRKARNAAALFLCAILPVAASLVVSDSLSFDNPIGEGSIREALSLPFQQTARYVRDFGAEVTAEEAAAIDAVLDYEHIAANYRPRIADPVKDTYRETATAEDLAAYFRVWFAQFLKHPSAYFLATIQQNYYIVYPFVPNDAIFSGLDYSDQERITKPLGLHPVEELAVFQQAVNRWYHMCFRIPGLSLLCHLSLYAVALLWLTLYAWRRRLYLWLLPALPVLFSLAVVVASPVIQGHPRYAFPIYYTVPALAAFWSYLARRKAFV